MLAKITQCTLFALLVMGLTACGEDTKTNTTPPAKTASTEPTKVDSVKADNADTNNTNTDNTKKADDNTEDGEAKADSKASDKQDDTPLSADAGQKRYEATCKLCHDQGLLNAPKKGDKTEWAKRISKGKETLYAHSIKGFNKMPAQATGDVSEAEVKAAVDYLIAQSS